MLGDEALDLTQRQRDLIEQAADLIDAARRDKGESDE